MNQNFISFEGGEGSGKTTIIKQLKIDLEKQGFKVLQTREPGGSEIAEGIRQIILNIANVKMDPRTEALLYAASRRQHLVEVILPALQNGNIVLCDRFVDSSLAYQGYARGLGINQIYELNRFAIEDLLPGLTIYLDLDPEIGLRRIKDNNRACNRLDLESLEFHKKVREGYLLIAKQYPTRIKVVNGSLSKEKLYEEVKKIVLDYFNINGD
ncbi:MAG TPA: dTMP kinase [Bacilli bacterium]|nr:dTMP kinase [Bacilli bacterium]